MKYSNYLSEKLFYNLKIANCLEETRFHQTTTKLQIFVTPILRETKILCETFLVKHLVK